MSGPPGQWAPASAALLVSAIALGAATTATIQTWVAVARGSDERHAGGADAIVVFGAEALPDRPSRELQARLDHATALWRAGRAPVILCSGGIVGDVSEAAVMARALRAAGVPASAIEVDDRGTCTRATIAETMRLGAGRWDRVIAVSSPYHMRRIELEARRQGLACTLSAPPDTPIMRHPRRRRLQSAREVVAIWFYAFEALTGRGASATAPDRPGLPQADRTPGSRNLQLVPAARRTPPWSQTPERPPRWSQAS